MASKYHRTRVRSNPATQRFVFATGIECSYPTVATPAGEKRRDQLEECGHYAHWREDLAAHARARPPRAALRPAVLPHAPRAPAATTGRVATRCSPRCGAWASCPSSTCATSACRTGWAASRTRSSPRHFAAYAGAFAERYPWVRFYTPVNEMYVAAQFSACYGWWNERLATHQAFVTALKHLVRANVDAMLAIIPVRPDALFIQSESSEYFHTTPAGAAAGGGLLQQAPLPVPGPQLRAPRDADMLMFLLDNGLTREEFGASWPSPAGACIMGNDYYGHNENLMLPADRTSTPGTSSASTWSRATTTPATTSR